MAQKKRSAQRHLNLFRQEIKSIMANKVDDRDRKIKELKKQLSKKDKELKRKDAALAELAAKQIVAVCM